VFGVSIDLTNSNPSTSVTYTDDAAGMTGGSSAWDNMPVFKDIKPCVLKNGAVQYYLNPSNFNQKANGTTSVLTGADGDVMIEFPKTGVAINTSGDTLTVKITEAPSDPNFRYYAHTRTTEGDRDKLYIGAFKGCVISSALRSVPGQPPKTSEAQGTFRTWAQANGSGYDLLSFYPMTLLQCLYLIRFKNLNSQAALGKGYVDGSAKQETGATISNGMYYGNTGSSTARVKCLGIEDLWGNVSDFVDGAFVDSTFNLLTAYKDFNDTGAGYTSRVKGVPMGGYVKRPMGSAEAGFILKEGGGSTTTYFSDDANFTIDYGFCVGGHWTSWDSAGIFMSFFTSASTSGSGTVGTRLMYL
jgi:hypothetical protein